MTTHRLQNPVVDMLQRNVEIRQHLRPRTGQESDERIRVVGRMRVEQPDHEIPRNRVKSFEQPRNVLPVARTVGAEGRDILRDHEQLLHAGIDEVLRLGFDRRDAPAPQHAADSRNRTITAAVVAPVRNLQISHVRHGQLQPRRGVVVEPERFPAALRNALFVEQRGDPGDIVDAGPQVDLRIAPAVIARFVPLGQAAGDDHGPARTLLLPDERLFDRLLRLAARGRDEGAGVDDIKVRLVRIERQRAAGGQQRPRNHLGIDQILRAAEADHVNRASGRTGTFFTLSHDRFFAFT